MHSQGENVYYIQVCVSSGLCPKALKYADTDIPTKGYRLVGNKVTLNK
jgi:hypothetical protein